MFLNLEECRSELKMVESGFSRANGRLAHEIRFYSSDVVTEKQCGVQDSPEGRSGWLFKWLTSKKAAATLTWKLRLTWLVLWLRLL